MNEIALFKQNLGSSRPDSDALVYFQTFPKISARYLR